MVQINDVSVISDTARSKLDRLQQGTLTLEQAVMESRRSMRAAAHERVGAAKEYLKLLVRVSPAGDRGAAREAARIAREIKSAVADFRESIAGEDAAGVRSEMSGFAGVAGDALRIAVCLVESYLRNNRVRQKENTDMEKDIGAAASALREMAGMAAVPASS